jgi:hypothetical protein
MTKPQSFEHHLDEQPFNLIICLFKIDLMKRAIRPKHLAHSMPSHTTIKLSRIKQPLIKPVFSNDLGKNVSKLQSKSFGQNFECDDH